MLTMIFALLCPMDVFRRTSNTAEGYGGFHGYYAASVKWAAKEGGGLFLEIWTDVEVILMRGGPLDTLGDLEWARCSLLRLGPES